MTPELTRRATSFLAAAGAVGLAGVLMRACPGSCTSCVTCASSLAPMGASAAAVGIAFASSAGMRAKRGTSATEEGDGMTGRPLAAAHRRRTKRARKALAAIVFVFLGRGLVAAAKHDSRVRAEVAGWPEETIVVLAVAPDGPKLTVRKSAGRLEYLGGKSPLAPTLYVEFKSVDVALPVLIGMKGVLQAFAEHRSILRRRHRPGDVARALPAHRGGLPVPRHHGQAHPAEPPHARSICGSRSMRPPSPRRPPPSQEARS